MFLLDGEDLPVRESKHHSQLVVNIGQGSESRLREPSQDLVVLHLHQKDHLFLVVDVVMEGGAVLDVHFVKKEGSFDLSANLALEVADEPFTVFGCFSIENIARKILSIASSCFAGTNGESLEL